MSFPRFSWAGSDVPLLVDHGAARFGVKVAFSCRLGGSSAPPFSWLNLSPFIGDDPEAVSRNQSAALSAAGFVEDSLVLTRQVHGAEVLDAPDTVGVAGDGDGLFSGSAISPATGTLGVLAADCVPILLKGEDGIATAHAGWRGVVGGVIEEAAGRTGSIEAAWIGPSIQACCYEVGAEVLDAFRSKRLPVAERGEGDKGRVAPGRAAAVILHRLGARYVAQTSICTSCDERFYSYRRDGITGRQGGFIAWA